MQGREAVVFRGDRAGVSVLVDGDAPFGDIVETLRRKLAAAGSFFNGASVRIDAGTRELDDVETHVLQALIRAHGLTLTGEAAADGGAGGNETSAAPRSEEADKPTRARTGAADDSEGASQGNGLDTTDKQCLLAERTLRSGQSLQFNGSVVVVGDVNPGAVVVATGDVIVMGALRGMVHAGAAGDTNAKIVALHLHPTQIRIAHYISRPPDDHEPAPGGAEMAIVADDRIQIEEYVP